MAAEAIDARIVDVVRAKRGPQAVPDLPDGRAWMFVEMVGAGADEADAAARLQAYLDSQGDALAAALKQTRGRD